VLVFATGYFCAMDRNSGDKYGTGADSSQQSNRDPEANDQELSAKPLPSPRPSARMVLSVRESRVVPVQAAVREQEQEESDLEQAGAHKKASWAGHVCAYNLYNSVVNFDWLT
jgi:hypothetical protein